LAWRTTVWVFSTTIEIRHVRGNQLTFHSHRIHQGKSDNERHQRDAPDPWRTTAVRKERSPSEVGRITMYVDRESER
jgi:hypothetical protein